eukprot:GHVL01015057.1.p1 GENE.GHVL01015057.1~~GHVL01015057.1.p1  ORF type:complete len:645 (+),score=200.51 GHVL01015057.1:65-1936(+)
MNNNNNEWWLNTKNKEGFNLYCPPSHISKNIHNNINNNNIINVLKSMGDYIIKYTPSNNNRETSSPYVTIDLIDGYNKFNILHKPLFIYLIEHASNNLNSYTSDILSELLKKISYIKLNKMIIIEEDEKMIYIFDKLMKRVGDYILSQLDSLSGDLFWEISKSILIITINSEIPPPFDLLSREDRLKMKKETVSSELSSTTNENALSIIIKSIKNQTEKDTINGDSLLPKNFKKYSKILMERRIAPGIVDSILYQLQDSVISLIDVIPSLVLAQNVIPPIDKLNASKLPLIISSLDSRIANQTSDELDIICQSLITINNWSTYIIPKNIKNILLNYLKTKSKYDIYEYGYILSCLCRIPGLINEGKRRQHLSDICDKLINIINKNINENIYNINENIDKNRDIHDWIDGRCECKEDYLLGLLVASFAIKNNEYYSNIDILYEKLCRFGHNCRQCNWLTEEEKETAAILIGNTLLKLSYKFVRGDFKMPDSPDEILSGLADNFIFKNKNIKIEGVNDEWKPNLTDEEYSVYLNTIKENGILFFKGESPSNIINKISYLSKFYNNDNVITIGDTITSIISKIKYFSKDDIRRIHEIECILRSDTPTWSMLSQSARSAFQLIISKM